MKARRHVVNVADRLECSRPRAESILRAVMRALRDGLSDTEAAMIEASLPADLRALWSRRAGPHPGLADLGDIGFLGRVQELAASPSDDETKRMVGVVMSVLMTAMAIPGDDRRAAWSALTHLPRESKVIWMKLFRAACFPVELYAQRPSKLGRRFSRNARTPSR
jgi:uncharacterized protein (DUF2267 family)